MNYYPPKPPPILWYREQDLGWEIDLGALRDHGRPDLHVSAASCSPEIRWTMGRRRPQEWGPIWMINNVLTYDF